MSEFLFLLFLSFKSSVYFSVSLNSSYQSRFRLTDSKHYYETKNNRQIKNIIEGYLFLSVTQKITMVPEKVCIIQTDSLRYFLHLLPIKEARLTKSCSFLNIDTQILLHLTISFEIFTGWFHAKVKILLSRGNKKNQ